MLPRVTPFKCNFLKYSFTNRVAYQHHTHGGSDNQVKCDSLTSDVILLGTEDTVSVEYHIFLVINALRHCSQNHLSFSLV